MASRTAINLGPAPSPSLERADGLLTRRVTGLPVWVVLIQLFIGLGWLRAAAEKLIDPSWWTGDQLAGFLADHDESMLAWYTPFVDLVVSPYGVLVAVVVVVAQLGVGLALLSGRFSGLALAVGMSLNLNFMASGAVNPSAFYLLSQGALLLWLAEQSASRQTLRRANAVTFGAAAFGAASLPFVSTLHPADVIDDPAMMFVVGSVLTVVMCDLIDRRSPVGSSESPSLSAEGWGPPATRPARPLPRSR